MENCILRIVRRGKKLHPDFICTFVLKKFLNTAILFYGLVSLLFIPKPSPFVLGPWQLTAISLHVGKGLDVETKDKSGRVKMCITQMHGFFTFQRLLPGASFFQLQNRKEQQRFYYSQNSNPVGTSVVCFSSDKQEICPTLWD